MGVWRAFFVCLAIVAAAGCIQAEPSSPDAGARADAPSPDPDGEAACEPPALPPGTPTVGPEQGGVTNQPGSFTYGGQAAAKTGIEHYLWENPSGAAQVTWGGQMAAGSVRLTIVDACGVEMYAAEKSGPSQGGEVEGTSRGEPGEWLLTFDFVAHTGQMGITVTSA